MSANDRYKVGEDGKDLETIEDLECPATVAVTPSQAVVYEGLSNYEMDNTDLDARVVEEPGVEDAIANFNDEVALNAGSPPQVRFIQHFNVSSTIKYQVVGKTDEVPSNEDMEDEDHVSLDDEAGPSGDMPPLEVNAAKAGVAGELYVDYVTDKVDEVALDAVLPPQVNICTSFKFVRNFLNRLLVQLTRSLPI